MIEQNLIELKNLYSDLEKALVNKDALNVDKYSSQIYSIVQSLTKENTDKLVSFLDDSNEEEISFKNYILDLIVKEDEEWNANKIKMVGNKLYGFLEKFVDNYLNYGLNNESVEDDLDEVVVLIEDCIKSNNLEIIDNILNNLSEEIVLKEDPKTIEMYEWLKSLVSKRISVEYLPVEVSDSEDFKFKFSQIMFLPVILMADNKKLEVPSISVLEKLIRAEFHKRKIAEFNEVNLGTVVYAMSEVEQCQYNDVASVHMCVIDEVEKNISIEEQKRLKELRLNTTVYEGDSSICFFVLNLKLDKNSLENINNKQELFEKALKDKELWDAISKKLKNIYTNYSILEPNYINIIKESINRYKTLALVKTWLKKNANNIDVVYAHDELEEKYFIMLADIETGQCIQGFSSVINENKLEWLEIIKKTCDEANVLLYKYNNHLSENDYQKILTVDYYSNDSSFSSDLNDILKDSTIVGSEWESWTDFNNIKPTKLLH